MNSGVDGRGREGSESHYLVFAHTSPHGAIELMPWRESLGTYKFVGLAPILYDLTRGDGNRAVFVDEIGASLHPHLLFALVRSANETLENSEPCGQLIFATHDTSILDDEARDAVLRRDQIFLTDKDDCGASKLYSVAEFQERHNVNIRKRYLDGRYGALPAPSLMRF
jgi:AAA15 family ATPase/GTPase